MSENKMQIAAQAMKDHGSLREAAKSLGIPLSTFRSQLDRAKDAGIYSKTKIQEKKDSLTIDYRGAQITSPQELLKKAKIDMDVWEEVETTINSWEVSGKLNEGQEVITLIKENANGVRKEDHLRWKPQKLWKAPLRQIKIRLKKKSNERRAIESLLKQLETKGPIVPKIKRPKVTPKGTKRCLEISIMDPHFGMMCFPPGADHAWSLEDCERIVMWAIDSLIKQAEFYAPIEQILMPFGNDFLHVDNVWGTTTGGTNQTEALPWHHIYERAEYLAIAMVERMKEVAPVRVLEIPGNHDRQSAFTLARVLRAYYRQDKNVEVDASASPYKFHHYGCNLIGFEHGHSVSTIRLAALMANEAPEAWAATKGGYREWHVGDQHRKGSSKPSVMEEQGVSVEYLPGLTPPNEWHRLKSFNWQKRGAMAWIWDYHTGPLARIQVNLNSFTGQPQGQKRSA